LDLDETLIHCNEQKVEGSDIQLQIKFPTGQKMMVIKSIPLFFLISNLFNNFYNLYYFDNFDKNK
jgi:hypothetical protein